MTGRWADVIHNVLALRAKPEGGSEQISQAILGDAVEILEERDGYARVRGHDAYEGWALHSQLAPCAEADGFFRRYGGTPDFAKVTAPFADFRSPDGELITRVVFGTPVHTHGHISQESGGEISVAVMLPSGLDGIIGASALQPAAGVSSPASIARQFLGTPYLWGGTTPFGFDCSGLMQRAYSAAGVTLPRDAHQQAASPLGQMLPEDAPLRSGDLVFFLGKRDPHKRGITLVGMTIDSARMVHAHGKTGVTIEALHGEDIRSAYTYRGAWRLREKVDKHCVGY